MRHTRQRFDEVPADGGRRGRRGPGRGFGPEGFGPGRFGPEGFGPEGFGPGAGPERFGPEEFGPGGRGRGPHGGHRGGPGGHGRHGGPEGRGGRGGPGGRGRGGRAQRGDVRTAVLLVVGEEPMHGYQIMQAIAERSGGVWRPSPGAIYPTIAQLQDEGLVTVAEEGGRRQVTLTDAGRSEAEQRVAEHGDPFDQLAERSGGADLRGPVHELGMAARQIRETGTPEQVTQALAVLAEARRSLYLILAGEPVGKTAGESAGEAAGGAGETPQGER